MAHFESSFWTPAVAVFTCWQASWLQSSFKKWQGGFPWGPSGPCQAHFLCLLVEFISCSYRTEKIYFAQPRIALSSIKKTNKQKLQLNRVKGAREGTFTSVTTVERAGRRRFLFFPGKRLSQWKVMDSSLNLPSQSAFSSQWKHSPSLTMWDLNVSSPWLQKVNSILCSVWINLSFLGGAGEITGNLFDLNYCLVACMGMRRLNNSGEQIWGACIHKAEPVRSLIYPTDPGLKGTQVMSLCIWILSRLYSGSS